MAASLVERLLVKIGADSKELRRESSKSVAAIKRIGKAGKQLARTFLRVGAAATGLAFIGKRLFLDKFAAQQDAVEGLRTALKVTGKEGEASLDLVVNKARELQKQTTAADEALISATSTLAQLAPSLNPQELAKSQEAIVAIADTFLKGDVENAALLLGKTLGSTTNALTRYGIQIENTAAPASQKLADILGNKALAAAFEVSQTKAKTWQGRLTQLTNATGDFQEVIGGILVDIGDLTTRSKTMTDRVQELTAEVSQNRDEWIAWGKVGVSFTKLVIRTLGTLVRIAFEVGQIIGRSLDIAAMTVVAAWSLATDEIQGAANAVFEGLDRIPGVDIEFRFDTEESEGVLDRLRTQSEGLKADVSAIGETVDNLGESWHELGTAVDIAKRLREELREQEDAVAEGPDVAGGGAGATIEEIKKGATSLREELIKAGAAGADLAGEVQGVTMESQAMAEVIEEEAAPAWGGFKDAAASNLQTISSGISSMTSSFTNLLTTALTKGKIEFGRFARAVIAMIAQIAAKLVVFRILTNIFGTANPAFLAAGLVGGIGGRAAGGVAFSGQPVRVGEFGEEILIPTSHSRVVSNGELRRGRSGGAVTHLQVVLEAGGFRQAVDRVTIQQDRDEKLHRRVQIPAVVIAEED